MILEFQFLLQFVDVVFRVSSGVGPAIDLDENRQVRDRERAEQGDLTQMLVESKNLMTRTKETSQDTSKVRSNRFVSECVIMCKRTTNRLPSPSAPIATDAYEITGRAANLLPVFSS